MLDRVASEEERIAGLASVYDAALARSRTADRDTVEAMSSMTSEVYEMTVIPPALAGGMSPVPPMADWSATIGLVERAAATIKAYERRFVQLDIHTRALIDRAGEEQARLQAEIVALEQKLHDSEERAMRAEGAMRDEAFYRWEAERRLREAEARISEAEDHSRQSDDYLRRVHSVLADL